jgi:hypothetical protein
MLEYHSLTLKKKKKNQLSAGHQCIAALLHHGWETKN